MSFQSCSKVVSAVSDSADAAYRISETMSELSDISRHQPYLRNPDAATKISYKSMVSETPLMPYQQCFRQR
jgi:hypothetical protein